MARRPNRNIPPPPKPKINPRTAERIINNLSEEELLYRTIWYEANGEGLLGMALVANAIFNRKDIIDQGVRIGLFQAKDKTIKGILTGKNQFEPVTGNKRVISGLNALEKEKVTEAIALASDKRLLENEIKNEVEDISKENLLSLLNATGFRSLNARPDRSQDVNVVTFKGHKFNTAGNKDKSLVELEIDRNTPTPKEKPTKEESRSIMDFMKKLLGVNEAAASTVDDQTDKMLGLTRQEKKEAAEISDDPLSDAMGPRLITQQKSSPVDRAALRKELQFFNQGKEDKEPMGSGDEESDSQMLFPNMSKKEIKNLASNDSMPLLNMSKDEIKNLASNANVSVPDTTKNEEEDLPESNESDDFSSPLNYSIIDKFEESDEIGSGKKLNPEKDMEPRERSEQDLDYFVDEAQPMGGEFEGDDIDAGSGPVDFSFIKSLFSGGFDTGRNSESELNIDADYFYDEAQPLGGEADPNDDVLRFDEGGTADFDGKKEEDDDEGDPPPLAKPEEVADDIPAMLSEGEYVLPANVVRYLGLERIMDMHRQVLSEIQQMEDLGMIQNVDKNGEPEEDDKEMKFLKSEEPEEGEEAVSKGTLIIASSKPKGMMCPEPLKFMDGGMGDPGGQSNEADAADAAAAAAAADQADMAEAAKGREKDKDRDTSLDSGDEKDNIDPMDFGGFTEREMSFAASPNRGTGTAQDTAEKGLNAIGEFVEEVLGYEITEKDAKAREAAEAEASQPGDSDDDQLDGKIDDKDIKVSKVNDVIADLKNKNVYIPGVGYYPLPSLMSPQDTTIV